MGSVRMGPPEELILALQRNYQLDCFVETGTFLGETSLWASAYFNNVITIENSRSLFAKATAGFKDNPAVDCLYGDSRTQLELVIGRLSAPAIFWLDSHWCGGESFGESDQCPLLDELAVMNSSSTQHLLFIDDARLFTSPPPLPNRVEQWPSITQVCRLLELGQFERYVVIFEDVIIAVSTQMQDAVATWCQNANTAAWQAAGAQSRQTKRQRGLRQAVDGLRLLSQSFRD